MTTVDQSEQSQVSLSDRWLLLVAMIVYSAGVSFYSGRSILGAFHRTGGTVRTGGSFELTMVGFTFLSIVASAIGFMLLAGLLDIWTGRKPQPLAALNLALPAVATFELIKMPLLMVALQVWFWATR